MTNQPSTDSRKLFMRGVLGAWRSDRGRFGRHRTSSVVRARTIGAACCKCCGLVVQPAQTVTPYCHTLRQDGKILPSLPMPRSSTPLAVFFCQQDLGHVPNHTPIWQANLDNTECHSIDLTRRDKAMVTFFENLGVLLLIRYGVQFSADFSPAAFALSVVG